MIDFFFTPITFLYTFGGAFQEKRTLIFRKDRMNNHLIEQYELLNRLYKDQSVDISAYDLEGNHLLSSELRQVCLTCELSEACPKTAINLFQNSQYITPETIETLRKKGIASFTRQVIAKGELDEKRVMHKFNVTIMAVKDNKGILKGYLIRCEDLTENLQRELQLAEKNTIAELALKAKDIGVWRYHIRMKRFFGVLGRHNVPPEGISFDDFTRHLHPDYTEECLRIFHELETGVKDKANAVIGFLNPITGKIGYHNNAFASLRNSAGEIAYIICAERDVTEERKYEKGLELLNAQLNQVLRMSHIIPFIWYPQRERFYIRNFEIKDEYSVFIKGTNERTYQEVLASNHPDDREAVKKMLEDMRNGKMKSGWCKTRYDAHGKYDRTFIVSLSVDTTMQQGDELSFMGFMHDITSDEQMIRQLIDAKHQAEESDRLKSTFLANMSHEIRTPLNAIVGFSDILQVTEDPKEREEYYQIISKNNQLLLQLVNDILELSRIEAGRAERIQSVFDLNETFNTCFRTYREIIKNPDVEVQMDIPEETYLVNWDKRRTIEILNNFVNNADKYTTKGYIRIGFKEVEDKQLKIFVEDTGCGISEENAKLVFNRFEKLNSFKQGAGLGMAICQSYVKEAEGTIGVDSRLEVGSTFWAVIPQG